MDERQETYGALLKRHWAMLWRMCWRHAGGDRSRCEDLMQEVCIALWENREKLRTGATSGEERAWVRWQARSVFYQTERRKGPKYVSIDTVENDYPAEDAQTVDERIEEILAVLSSDERRMVRMRMEGYDGKEIGEAMGVSRDAVYQRIGRAIRKMRHAVLILLVLLPVFVVATITVPSLRQLFFPGPHGDAEPSDTTVEREPSSEKSAEPSADTTASPSRQDTGARGNVTLERMAPMDVMDFLGSEPPEIVPLADIESGPRVSVKGQWLVLEGVRYERVQVYDARGRQVSSQTAYEDRLIVELPPYSQIRSSEFVVCIGSRPEIRVRL